MDRYFKLIISWGAIFALLMNSACTKGEFEADGHISDFSDSTVPVVVIASPTSNQVFKSGDVIQIRGKVTDNSLYQGKVRVVDDATSTIILEQAYEIHGYQVYNFTVACPTEVTVVSHYTVSVEFEDHGLNEGTQSVGVTVKP